MSMRNKLTSKQGFSLSEMLVAVLIIAMVVAIVAGGGKVAKNAYQNVTLKAEAATLMSTTITKLTDEFRFASDITTPGAVGGSGVANEITFQSGVEGYKVYLTNAQQGAVTSTHGAIHIVPVAYAEDNPTNRNYWVPLLTDKTMTDGLTPTITGIEYQDGVFEATIEIYQDQLGNAPYASQTIKVRPLNE